MIVTYDIVLAAALSIPSPKRNVKNVAATLGTTPEDLRAFVKSLPKDSPMRLMKNNTIRTGTKRGGGGGGKREPIPSKPNVAMEIATDPGGTSKEDIYRQCLLKDVEQCNWRMRRAMKG